MALKLKKDDLVEVISGNDKGKRGRVLAVDNVTEKVTVEGINLRTHHEKVRQTKAGNTGGREQREGAIHRSKVQVVDPKTSKPTRIGSKVENDKRVRVTRGRNASGSVVG